MSNNDTILNLIDLDIHREYFELNGYVLLNNFFFTKYTQGLNDSEGVITKTHSLANKKNQTVFVQGVYEFFIYSYFISSLFYELLLSLTGKSVTSDKKVDISSVEQVLGLKRTGKGIIMESYKINDYYNFNLLPDKKTYGCFLYVVSGSGSIKVTLNEEVILLKKNDILILGNKEFQTLLINDGADTMNVLIGNLVYTQFGTEMVYKCNL